MISNDSQSLVLDDTPVAAVSAAVVPLAGDGVALWMASEQLLVGSPYQSFVFSRAYLQACASDTPSNVHVLALYDQTQRPILTLPFICQAFGPFRIARPIGGAHANFVVPFFDPAPCAKLEPTDIRSACKKALSTIGIDVLLLPHAPSAWLAHTSPLIALDHRPSVNLAHKGTLQPDPARALRALRSKESLRKISAKKKKLANLGTLQSSRAQSVAEKKDLIQAYRRLKEAWSQQRQIQNEFISDQILGFYLLLANEACFDMWSVRLNDEVIAVCGGFAGKNYFSLAIISSEQDRFAALSPGDILVEGVLSDLAVRGFTGFDFGTGDAEYKRRWMPDDLPMIDIVHAISLPGQVAALVLSAGLSLKSMVKAQPRLAALAKRLTYRVRGLT